VQLSPRSARRLHRTQPIAGEKSAQQVGEPFSFFGQLVLLGFADILGC
jgi:hypothetical protein